MLRFRFFRGTLELRGEVSSSVEAMLASDLARAKFDLRTRTWRCPANDYAKLVTACRKHGVQYGDEARRYEEVPLTLYHEKNLRPYQEHALERWRAQQRQGVVVLPTGAGKTEVAVRAMLETARSTLIVVPTLELVRQWVTLLETAFRVPIGIVGGGAHTVENITVTTYDSAHLHMDTFGDRFGLLIFDECHHLPSESYAYSARASIAPFRLGLTATPERADGKNAVLFDLVGPLVYRQDITDLAGEFLSDYETERIYVELLEQERLEYEDARDRYRAFIAKSGIKLGSPGGFQRFLAYASRSEEGLAAMEGFRTQRAIAFGSQAKLDTLGTLLSPTERTLIFTEDNRTAYRVSLRFLVPCITHHTHVRERIRILAAFRSGEVPTLVTSKVLNEGIDVPEASVAIILSGNASVREHVQRLGRILRPMQGKQARLIELVTKHTSEESTSKRRRDHNAYR